MSWLSSIFVPNPWRIRQRVWFLTIFPSRILPFVERRFVKELAGAGEDLGEFRERIRKIVLLLGCSGAGKRKMTIRYL
jgi:hypothetical protein